MPKKPYGTSDDKLFQQVLNIAWDISGKNQAENSEDLKNMKGSFEEFKRRFQGATVDIWRMLEVRSAKEFITAIKTGKVKHVGLYWSWGTEKANVYDRNESHAWAGREKVLLQAIAKPDAINLAETIAKNSVIDWEEEITLKKGSRITLVNAQTLPDAKIFRIDKPVLAGNAIVVKLSQRE